MQEIQEMWVWSLGQEDPLGGGHGNPLQYPCLGNPIDREAWWATVHEVINEVVNDWATEHSCMPPGGPEAKTTCSQCRGPRFDPCSGNQIPCVATRNLHATKPCMPQWRSEVPVLQLRPYSQINTHIFFLKKDSICKIGGGPPNTLAKLLLLVLPDFRSTPFRSHKLSPFEIVIRRPMHLAPAWLTSNKRILNTAEA